MEDAKVAGRRELGRRPLEWRPGLDGVRALAVAGVLLYHAQVSAVSGGFLGVDVFFVLSGFLITSLLLHEFSARDGGTGGIRLAQFWLARARRLLPAALLVVAVALIVIAIWHPVDLGSLRVDALASVFYVNNWHQVFAHQSYFAHFNRPSLLQHYWSLAVEEQFYLIWPPVLLLLLRWLRLRRRHIAGLAALGAVTSGLLMAALYDPQRDPSRVYYGTDTRAMPILIGVALACCWPVMGRVTPIRRSARWIIDAAGLAGLGIVLFAMLRWTDYSSSVYRGGLALLAVGAALLVGATAHPASRLSAVFGTRPLVWLGRRSYGIYLWHWPVMALSRPDLDVHLSPWLLVPAQTAVTLVLAAASYKFVELPIRQRRVQQWLRDRVGGLAAVRRKALAGATVGALAVFIAGIGAWPVPARFIPLKTTQSAQAATPASQLRPFPAVGRLRTQPQVAPHGPVLAIGASVMLAAKDELQQRLHATVDAKIGRQPEQILARLDAYRRHHAFPPVVVVQIGENGPFTAYDARRLQWELHSVARVILLNLRDPGESWIVDANRRLAQLSKTWAQATLADWHDASANRKLTWDGAHPDPAGQRVYAETVMRAIYSDSHP